MRYALVIALAVLPAALVGCSTSAGPLASPRDATVCELSRAAITWDKAVVRVSGVAGYAFEHFTLSDPACPEDDKTLTPIWLTYGGHESPRTIYCCPGEGGVSTRDESLVIDGVSLPIEDGETFRRLRERLRKVFDAGGEDLSAGVAAKVTVVGTFFARGRQEAKANGNSELTGFGHFACCSLLVIQRVEQFDEIRSPPRAAPVQ